MNSPFIFFKNNLKSKSTIINLLRKHIPLNDERLKLIKEKNQIDKNLIRKTEIKIASNGLIDEIKIKANELFEEINFKIDQPLEKRLKIEYLKEKLIEVSTIGNDLREIAINLNPKITLEDYKDLYKSLSSDKLEITTSNTDTIITYDDFENDILDFSERFPPLLFKKLDNKLIKNYIEKANEDDIILECISEIIDILKKTNEKLIVRHTNIIPSDNVVQMANLIPILSKPTKKPSQVNFTEETIEILSNAYELKDKLILEDESHLVKALNNQNIPSKIIFVGNRNSFVELFKRIRYHCGLSCNDNIGLASWINKYFLIQKDFNSEADDFTFDKAMKIIEDSGREPAKNNRILANEFKYVSIGYR